MKLFRLIWPGVRPLVYSNLFLACCAAAYTAKTSLLLYGNNGTWLVNSLVFYATLFLYCFHRINKKRLHVRDENMEERDTWVNKYKSIFYVLIAASAVALSIELCYMPRRTWVVFIPVGALGLGYTFPIIPSRKGWKRLRDIYWLKTFWIAFAFSWLTTFLPVLYTQPLASLWKPEVLFIFSRGLLFLFAICIPFDIRDMEFDKRKGVITLPVKFGAQYARYIAVGLLLCFIILAALDFLCFNLNAGPTVGLLVSALITILLLGLAKTRQTAILFSLLYDSAMLLQWLLILLCIYIF